MIAREEREDKGEGDWPRSERQLNVLGNTGESSISIVYNGKSNSRKIMHNCVDCLPSSREVY